MTDDSKSSTAAKSADVDSASEEADASAADDSTAVDIDKPAGAADPEAAEEEEVLDPLEKAEREASEWRDRAMRTQAELENFRKRMTRERGEAIQYANARLFESLLPILDNFEMGLNAARAESEESMIYQGMNMVHRQMQDFLGEHGIQAVDSVGQAFDPNLHEAVEQQASDEVAEGHIIAELRRGYRLGERLLRAANVIVSKGEVGGAEGDAGAAEDEDSAE